MRRSSSESEFPSSPLHRQLNIERLERRWLLTTYEVDTNLDQVDEDDGLTSLREAISSANLHAGEDIITFHSSLAGETLSLDSGELTVSDSLIIQGLGEDLLTIDASGSDPTPEESNGDGSRLFNIDDLNEFSLITVRIEGVTLTGGDEDENGGAVRSVENLAIENASVTNNSSGAYGGGIYASGSLTLTLSTVSSNASANRGGGLASVSSQTTVLQSDITGNTGFGGAGIFNQYDDLLVENSTISGNTATSIGGGGIRNYRADLTLIDSILEQNTAGYGAGIRSNFGDVTISGSSIDNNTGTSAFSSNRGGGGIYTRFGDLTLTESRVSGNTSRIKGGGIYATKGTVQISGSTIANNYTETDGGGVYGDGVNIVVEDSTISGNTALEDGGGLIRTSSFGYMPVSVRNSLVHDNHAGGSAGGLNASYLEVHNSTVTNNSAGGGGGGVSGFGLTINGGTIANNAAVGIGGGVSATMLSMSHAQVLNNSSSTDGGGIATPDGNLEIVASTITGNTSDRSGGGIHIRDGQLTVTNSLLDSNTALAGQGGGAIYARATVSISDSVLTDNVANYEGGAITLRDGELTIAKSVFSSNSSIIDGGAIYSEDRLAVFDSLFFENIASRHGGAIAALSGEVSIAGSHIYRNSADGLGGGTYSRSASLTISNSSISENLAGGDGGGTYHGFGSLIIIGSSLYNNSATGRGGGLHSESNDFGNIEISSSTFTGNDASEDGGAISLWSSSAEKIFSIRHSTLSENSAGLAAGGVILSAGTLHIDHSIIAKNDAAVGPDLTGLIGVSIEPHFSLIGDNSASGLTEAPIGTPDVNGNLIGGPSLGIINPLLADAANNGGPGVTHELLPSSPALDAGDISAVGGAGTVPNFDGRGNTFARIAGGRIDIGAYERQTIPDLQLVVDTLSDISNGNHSPGDLSLREAIGIANSNLELLDTIRFSSELTLNTTAKIDLFRGELLVTDSLNLIGSGQHLLTLDASHSDPTPNDNNGDGSRIFNIDNGLLGPDIQVALSGLTLTGGDVSTEGGAIRSRVDLTISDSTIENNSADTGGGVQTRGPDDVTISNSTFRGNSARIGGGLSSTGYGQDGHPDTRVTIVGTTIADNHATSRGGGVSFGVVFNSRVLFQVLSSTVTGNTADYQGGGVYLNLGTLIARSSTIAENYAANEGGGIGTQSGRQRIHLWHSIIATNSSGTSDGPDIAAMSVIYYSLVGDATGAQPQTVEESLLGTSGNPIDPLLGPLKNNGGTTLTRALMAGSPAIDAGDVDAQVGVEGVQEYDQRGDPFDRIVDGRIDIGALETQPIPNSADFDYDKRVTGLDFLRWQVGFGKSGNAEAIDGDADYDADVDSSDLSVWEDQYATSPKFILSPDMNKDGRVDGLDFFEWQLGFGTIYDSTHLGAWEEAYETRTPVLSISGDARDNTDSHALNSRSGEQLLTGIVIDSALSQLFDDRSSDAENASASQYYLHEDQMPRDFVSPFEETPYTTHFNKDLSPSSGDDHEPGRNLEFEELVDFAITSKL